MTGTRRSGTSGPWKHPPASRARSGMASCLVAVVAPAVLLFLGVIVVAALSGCEFVYLPECDYDCQAAGGSDSYSRQGVQ